MDVIIYEPKVAQTNYKPLIMDTYDSEYHYNFGCPTSVEAASRGCRDCLVWHKKNRSGFGKKKYSVAIAALKNRHFVLFNEIIRWDLINSEIFEDTCRLIRFVEDHEKLIRSLETCIRSSQEGIDRLRNVSGEEDDDNDDGVATISGFGRMIESTRASIESATMRFELKLASLVFKLGQKTTWLYEMKEKDPILDLAEAFSRMPGFKNPHRPPKRLVTTSPRLVRSSKK